MEHDPARICIDFDVPRQFNLMRAELFDRGIEIINAEGNKREARRNWILRWNGFAFKDDEINTVEIEVWPIAVMREQTQADHVTIEVGTGGDIFGPQSDNGKFGCYDKPLTFT